MSISNNTQPKAQMSVRWSTARPRACSGLMYAAVPRMMPARVALGIIVGDCVMSTLLEPEPTPMIDACLASPKSRTLTVPADEILMLPGFRSRWTIPRSCAAAMASAICRAMATDLSIGSPRAPPRSAMHSASVWPSTNSITSAVMPDASSTP